MSEFKVDKISPGSGTSITLGDSGDTFTIPSGVILAGDGSNLTGISPSKATIEALGIELPAANLTGTIHADRYTDTVYTHPTTAGNKHIPTAGATDQVLTYSSSGTASWADPAGGGKILQVVESTSIDSTFINSTTFVDLDLEVTITPSATSSKVLVLANFYFTQDDGGSGDSAYIQLVRTSTAIGYRIVGYESSHGATGNHCSIMKLDSPGVDVATTYKIQAKTNNANSDFRPGAGDNTRASIVAMEVSV